MQQLSRRKRDVSKYDKSPRGIYQQNLATEMRKRDRRSTIKEKNEFSRVSKEMSLNTLDVRSQRNAIPQTSQNRKGIWSKIIHTIKVILTLWEFFIIFIFLSLCLIQYSFFSIAYILFSIWYIYAAIHIDPVFYNLRIYLGIGLLLTSLITLLFKLIFTGLIISNAFEGSKIVPKSFGILVVDKESVDAIDIIKTLVTDITILFLSPTFIGNSRQVLERYQKNDERFEKSQILWMEARIFYKPSIFLAVVASTISTFFVPSATWFVILILDLLLIYQWSSMNFCIENRWTRFIYIYTCYISVMTFVITYILQIPIINQELPETALMIIGFGCTKKDLSVSFWFRNFTIVCYFCLYHLNLRTRNMKIMHKAYFVQERPTSKDIAKMK